MKLAINKDNGLYANLIDNVLHLKLDLLYLMKELRSNYPDYVSDRDKEVIMAIEDSLPRDKEKLKFWSK